MYELKLNEQERTTLHETLRSLVSELGMEIAQTERVRFRDTLKQRRDTLRGIAKRLEATESTEKSAA
jgi:uncharacterized membrane protein